MCRPYRYTCVRNNVQSLIGALDLWIIGALKRYLDLWNVIDVASLVMVVWTAIRLLFHCERGATTTIAAINTTLLWFRMIHYLSGPKITAPYVRMFTAITLRMMTFLIMLLIFVVGNCFVLLMLFPEVHLESAIC